MDSVKHASIPQPFFQKTANFMLLPYIYILRVRVCDMGMWYYKDEEWREKRKTVVRKIPWTSWTPWTIAGSKTKTKINPLKRMEGDALLPNLPLWSYKSELITPKTKDWAPPSSWRSPSSSRGLFWFLSCFQQGVQVVQKVQEVQWDLSNDCLSHLFSPFLFLTISHPHITHAHA